MQLTALESTVLEALLAGNDPALVALRAQLDGITVTTRDSTGVGFFTHVAIRGGATPAALRDVRLGDVNAQMRGLRHGAGFLLYVEGGFIHMLEGYSYDEEWPAAAELISWSYVDPARATLRALLASAAEP